MNVGIFIDTITLTIALFIKYQTSHVFSFIVILQEAMQAACFEDDWYSGWEDQASVTSVHDFVYKHSRFLIGNSRIFPVDIAIWDTQHPIVTEKNWLTTELKSPLAFILKFCVLFHSRFVLVNFSGDSLSREPCILFLLLNICPLTLSSLKLKRC